MSPTRPLLVTVLVCGLLAPAWAATAQERVTPIDLRLTAIDGVLQADGAEDELQDLHGTLQLDGGDVHREDLRLGITLYSRVTTPEALDAALMGDTEAAYASVSVPLPDLIAGVSQVVTFAATPSELDLVGADVEGVYPLELRVFEGAEPVGAISSAIVVRPDPQRSPMRAALVVTVDASALPGADGALDDSLRSLIAPDAPLVVAARELGEIAEDGSAAGTTLALNGRLLADLADLADGARVGPDVLVDQDARIARRAAAILGHIRSLVARGDVEGLATPYGQADLVALTRAGQGEEVVGLLDLGVQVVAEVTGEQPNSRIVLPPDGVDAETVAAMGPAGADAMLLDPRFVSVPEGDAIEPVRRLRTADGGEVRILVPDAGLSDLLQDPRDVGTAMVVQRLRAETALRWMAPEAPNSQALLLHTTVPGLAAPGALVAVSDALADTSWLRPVSLSTLASEVTVSDRGARLAYPPSSRAAELDEDYTALLGQAREALAPLAALLPEGDDTATRFSRTLRVAASTAFRGVEARAVGLARIQRVLDTLKGLTAAVRVIEGPPITLTSTAGEIPVALANDADLPLDVRVRVASPRFSFDAPVQELTLPPRSVQTLTFRARALNPGGLAAVGVVVEDPSGNLNLVSSTLAVRSTSVPVVALLMIIGGAALLLVQGVRQGRRRRTAAGTVGKHESQVA